MSKRIVLVCEEQSMSEELIASLSHVVYITSNRVEMDVFDRRAQMVGSVGQRLSMANETLHRGADSEYAAHRHQSQTHAQKAQLALRKSYRRLGRR